MLIFAAADHQKVQLKYCERCGRLAVAESSHTRFCRDCRRTLDQPLNLGPGRKRGRKPKDGRLQ